MPWLHPVSEAAVCLGVQYRAWQQSGHFFIQMDLAENGSLGHLLRQVFLLDQRSCL